MKRTTRVLLALLAIACFSVPVQALAEEESVLIRVETAEGATDGTVDLPVLLDRCTGVDSVQFDINYDSSALSFISVTPGDLFEAQFTVTNADEPGRIRVACASALGLEGAGTLLTIRFRVLSDAGSAVTITSGVVTRVDEDYNQSEAYVAIENGGVTVDEADLPEAVVTPWVPATPIPTPSPEPSPSPEPTQSAQPASSADVQPTAPAAESIPTITYYVAGGLLLGIAALTAVLVRHRRRADSDDTDQE